MSNPNKANDYLTLLNAAAQYRTGEHIYARTLVDSMADPLDDCLRLIGVLMAASAALAEEAETRTEVTGYVVSRCVDVNPN